MATSGFCTIAAQQFQDFIVLIGRPDWLEDTELQQAPGRVRRREKFNRAVRAWTAPRSTAEVIDEAAALRIPLVPLGSPSSLLQIDQFVERGVFAQNPGGFLQPGPPYRISTTTTRPVGHAPDSVIRTRNPVASATAASAPPREWAAATRWNLGARFHRVLGGPLGHVALSFPGR